MSEKVSPTSRPTRRPRLRRVALTLVALVLLLFVLPGVAPVLPLAVLWELASGWFEFLQRVVPQVIAQADRLPAFALALGVVLGGMHWFLGWLRKHQRSIAEGGLEKPLWRFRWTAAIAGLIAASTLLAMAGIGIIHQTGWMLVSKEPVWVEQGGGLSTAGIANMITRSIDNQYLSKALPPMAVPKAIPDDGPVWHFAKDYRVFALANGRGKFVGLIVFRKPGTFGNDRSIVVMDGPDELEFPPNELFNVIARYGDRMHLLK
jgi:hypothetical protein